MSKQQNLLMPEFAAMVTGSAKALGLSNGVLKSAVKSVDELLSGRATYKEKACLKEVGITEAQIQKLHEEASALINEFYGHGHETPFTEINFSRSSRAISETRLNHPLEDVISFAANIYEACSNHVWSNLYFKGEDGKFQPISYAKILIIKRNEADSPELFYKDKDKKFIEVSHLDSFEASVLKEQIKYAKKHLSSDSKLGKFYNKIEAHIQAIINPVIYPGSR